MKEIFKRALFFTCPKFAHKTCRFICNPMSTPGNVKSKSGERQKVESTMFMSRLFHIVLIELTFAIIGFVGFLDVAVINSTLMAWLQGAALLISLVLWILEIRWYAKYFLADVDKAEWEERGSSFHLVSSVYFLIAWLMHAVFLTAWIIWLVRYGDYSPLHFNVNWGPFIIKLLLLLAQFLMLFIILFFFIYDVRHVRFTRNFRSMGKSLASISSRLSSSGSSQ